MLKETAIQTAETIINMDALNSNKSSIEKADAKKKVQRNTIQRWAVDDIVALYEMPFNDLMFRAQSVHREHHDANGVQVSTLLSIKTGDVVKIVAIVLKQRAITQRCRMSQCCQLKKY